MMWCDDFDMDLPKVIPGARDALGDLANVILVTTGHAWSDGSLNHPTCWNGDATMLTFFGFNNPARPRGYESGRADVVECTFWEAVRDAWPHSYLIQVERQPVWDTFRLRQNFDAILYHTRGWRTLAPADIAARQGFVLQDLRLGVQRFRSLVQRYAGVRRRESP